MSRTTLNEIDTETTLSNEAQQAVRGGMGFWTNFGYVPYFTNYIPSFGGYQNVFNRGTFGGAVQSGTFSMMNTFQKQNDSWMTSFRSGW
ncbi:MAG: hypothetical protein AB8B93_07160 [Pseudomonadales bacterium]